MKPLDLYTVVSIIAAISLIFGILMWIFGKINPTIKGPMQWSLGSFSAVISSLLFVGLPQVGGYLSLVVSGAFVLLSIGLYWAGIREFKELRVNYKIVAGLVLLQLFFGSLFYLVFAMPNTRMVFYSAVTIIGYCLAIRELIRPADKPYRLAFHLCLIVFIISVLTSIFRIYTILTTLPSIAHSPSPANMLVYFFINIAMTMLLFSFMLLVSIKVSEQFKMKVENQHKFFSIIAHDLNGPVGMINEMLNLANNDNELPKDQKEMFLQEAGKLSNSTYQLLQNLLFWSRSQLEKLIPNIQKFDLNKLILENIEFLQQISKTKDISIEYEQATHLQCFGDMRMIDTVIRNLISNSIKYTHWGGKITISAEISEKHVVLKVKDNGVGMSADTQKNLFKFKEMNSKTGTDGESGTGLGLVICKEFVEGSKGTMTINSKENVGTEVLVKLQLA